MKRILALVALLGLLIIPQTALAYNPFQAACASGAGSGPVACANQTGADPVTGSNGVVAKAETIIAIIAGVAAVIIIITSAIKFVTAGGDAQKAAGARTTLIQAIIGLAIIVAAQAVLAFIISSIK